MTLENQENNSVDPASSSVKRKRGRPKKDDNSGSEPVKRTRRRKVDPTGHANDTFVGQVVSGTLDGKFDAGYMLTVRVGDSGTVLRGVVFEPGLSVPISETNDVAPHVKMLKREEIPLSRAEVKRKVPVLTPTYPVLKKDGLVKPRQRNEASLTSKGTAVKHVTEDKTKLQTHPSVGTTGGLPCDTNHVPIDVPHALQSDVNTKNSQSACVQEAVVNTNPSSLNVLQPAESEPKKLQAIEALDVKPAITNGPSDDLREAPTVVATLASETKTEIIVDPVAENETALQTGPLVAASRSEQSDKILIEIGSETAEGMANSTERKSEIHAQSFGSDDLHYDLKSQPSELKPQASASPVNPEPLSGNKTFPVGSINQVSSSDAVEATRDSASHEVDAVEETRYGASHEVDAVEETREDASHEVDADTSSCRA